MTAPPLPASPCLRVRLEYTNSDQSLAGSRFYLSYAGSAPTPGNCTTIAGDIEAAWVAGPLAMIHTDWALTEIDVLDITTLTGSSGQWTGSESGTFEGQAYPASIATNVEFGIARRYRGGKPRMFWPPPGGDALLDAGHWTSTFLTQAATNNATFWTDVQAIDVGTVGTLTHVNLSYYSGFKNITNSSGRTRAVPQYREAALLDTVESYAVKAEVGSQRRRRVSTSY
jgi:hypothetical protein